MNESEPRTAGHILCALEDIPLNSSKGFAADPEAYYADFLVVRTDEGVYAYRNHCPHAGAPMEWQPDQFLDYSQSYIQCGLHGALFQIESGYCVGGPCQGRSLESFPIEVRDGLLIALQDPELWYD